MLKKKSILFLGLVVLAGSACVTPTHASSALGPVLVYIQAAGDLGVADEMVAIYNNSPSWFDITDWCLVNKSNVAFSCFNIGDSDPNSGETLEVTDPNYAGGTGDESGSGDASESGYEPRYYLPAYSYALSATGTFVASRGLAPEIAGNFELFDPTDDRSGSIVNSGDTILLEDSSGEIVDSYSWSTAIPSGKVATRHKSLSNPMLYEISDLTINWSNEKLTILPMSGLELLFALPSPTDDGDGDGYGDESGDESGDGGEDEGESEGGATEAQVLHPQITELLPDPNGSDVGNEFIELYNPSLNAVNLDNYTLKIGPNLEKTFHFPDSSTIEPLSYKAFDNSQIKFTLVNSTSSVQLYFQGQQASAQPVSDIVTYSKPPSGQSWALVGDVWQYSNTPTPNSANAVSAVQGDGDVGESASNKTNSNTLKPCAANQFRNPETNRCKLISSTTDGSLKPCAENQERNPETNRCRKIASATSTPAPCKEGQERNPETNRCRNIVKMTKADYEVQGASTENTPTNWYMWLGILGVVALILAYGVWEWREELRRFASSLRKKFARTHE